MLQHPHGLLFPSSCLFPGMCPFMGSVPLGMSLSQFLHRLHSLRVVPAPLWVSLRAPVPQGYHCSSVCHPWVREHPLAQSTSFQVCISVMSPAISPSTCLFHFISPDSHLHIFPQMSPLCVFLCLLFYVFCFSLCVVLCTSCPSVYHPFLNMSEPWHHVLIWWVDILVSGGATCATGSHLVSKLIFGNTVVPVQMLS